MRAPCSHWKLHWPFPIELLEVLWVRTIILIFFPFPFYRQLRRPDIPNGRRHLPWRYLSQQRVKLLTSRCGTGTVSAMMTSWDVLRSTSLSSLLGRPPGSGWDWIQGKRKKETWNQGTRHLTLFKVPWGFLLSLFNGNQGELNCPKWAGAIGKREPCLHRTTDVIAY